MQSETISTNLRMPKNDWLQIKAMAGEVGMSTNGYINWLIRDLSNKRGLRPDVESVGDAPVWRLGELKGQRDDSKKLSPDDEIMYQ